MTNINYGGIFIILTSIAIGMSLSILPLSLWSYGLNPAWLVLIAVFWLTYVPGHMGLFSFFSIGMMQDLLHNSLLGEHALALLFVYGALQMMRHPLYTLSIWAQSVRMGGIVLIYQITVLLIQSSMIAPVAHAWVFLLSSISSMIVWPWVLFVMRGVAVKCYRNTY